MIKVVIISLAVLYGNAFALPIEIQLLLADVEEQLLNVEASLLGLDKLLEVAGSDNLGIISGSAIGTLTNNLEGHYDGIINLGKNPFLGQLPGFLVFQTDINKKLNLLKARGAYNLGLISQEGIGTVTKQLDARYNGKIDLGQNRILSISILSDVLGKILPGLLSGKLNVVDLLDIIENIAGGQISCKIKSQTGDFETAVDYTPAGAINQMVGGLKNFIIGMNTLNQLQNKQA